MTIRPGKLALIFIGNSSETMHGFAAVQWSELIGCCFRDGLSILGWMESIYIWPPSIDRILNWIFGRRIFALRDSLKESKSEDE